MCILSSKYSNMDNLPISFHMEAGRMEKSPFQQHELEINTSKMQCSHVVEWWNVGVVTKKVVESTKDMPPTQLGHLNNISRTKYNLKRQIQLTMHMREENQIKGFYMMLKGKVA